MEKLLMSISLIVAILAALFAYLGWVQGTQISKTDLEESIQRIYDESAVGDKNSNYELRPYRLWIEESDSWRHKFYRLMIPYYTLNGETHITMDIISGNITEENINNISDSHPDIDCRVTDVGAISCTIYRTEPEAVSKKKNG